MHSHTDVTGHDLYCVLGCGLREGRFPETKDRSLRRKEFVSRERNFAIVLRSSSAALENEREASKASSGQHKERSASRLPAEQNGQLMS